MQVLSLDRKFLDPRRPVGKLTEQDQEEMLVPYAPFVPLLPTAVLSYNHTVLQVGSRLGGFALRASACFVYILRVCWRMRTRP